jgi:hypothetical protein
MLDLVADRSVSDRASRIPAAQGPWWQRSASHRRGDQAGRWRTRQTGEFWWMEARHLRSFVDDLRRVPDLFARAYPKVGPRNYWDPLPRELFAY